MQCAIFQLAREMHLSASTQYEKVSPGNAVTRRFAKIQNIKPNIALMEGQQV